MRHHQHGPHCGCHKKVVCPTKYNVVNNYSQETVEYVHPSHTTVKNHHLIKNEHVFPHSTSVQNTVNSVDLYGGSFEVPSTPGAPGMGPGMGAPGMAPGMGPGMGTPGMAPGMGPGMGAPGMAPGMNPQAGPGMTPGNPNMNMRKR